MGTHYNGKYIKDTCVNETCDGRAKGLARVFRERVESVQNFKGSVSVTWERAYAKSTTYRILAGVLNVASSLGFTHFDILAVGLIAGSDNLVKTLVMQPAYEKISARVGWGQRIVDGGVTQTWQRICAKAIIYRVLASATTGAIAYGWTHNIDITFGIAGVDAITKTALFIMNEKGWDLTRNTWGYRITKEETNILRRH